MSTTFNGVADPASRINPFRADGTFRLPLDFTPGRHRPRSAYRKPKFSEDAVEFMKRRILPDDAGWDRGRQLAVIGDPLADDVAALYPKLGARQARALLDAALENGIDSVPDAPPALKALFAEVDKVPEWVDWKRVERGAKIMRRYAPLSWMFARFAFAQTYVNANAGMPLYMSGSLGTETVVKRLKETDRWRLGIQQPGALRRNADGFKSVVRVRVLHGLIRYHLLASGKWDVERLGMPIPQIDMAGANIGMFMTHSYLLQAVGAFMTPRELSDVIHFWRYHGYLIGTVDDLNPKSARDVDRISSLIAVTIRRALDERGRELTQSTMKARLRSNDGLVGELLDFIDIRVSHGIYQLLNGKRIFDFMHLSHEQTGLWILPAMFPSIFALDTLRRLAPGADRLADKLGRRYIDSVMQVDEVKNAPFKPYHQTA